MSKRQKITAFKSAILALPLLGSLAPTALADQPNELVIQDFVGTINWSNGRDGLEILNRKNERNLNVSTLDNVTIFDGGVKELDLSLIHI